MLVAKKWVKKETRNFLGFSKNGRKTVDRSIEWVRGFFFWRNFWGRKKWEFLGEHCLRAAGIFKKKKKDLEKVKKIGKFEISRKKLEFWFFLLAHFPLGKESYCPHFVRPSVCHSF